MKNLINAIQVRKKYNDMYFDDFVILYEKYYDVKISKHKREKFRFMGLNNCDFLEVLEEEWGISPAETKFNQF